jgi:glycosyltransferase involved in cell wall biosynthesis
MKNYIRPFFSLIIPTFNPNPTRLVECLNSISLQTCNDYQIIVVDAQSTKSDLVRHESSKVANSVYMLDVESCGVYPAINQAVKASKGDWIIILGHEDKLANERVLHEVKTFIIKRGYMFWLQGFYGNVVVEGDAGWAIDGQIYDGKFGFADLLSRNICHQSIFYRGASARLKGHSYSTTFKITSDWDYNIRAWTRGGMAYLPLVVSFFRGGGLSSSSEFDGFCGEEALYFAYWRQRRPYLLALGTLFYSRFAFSLPKVKKIILEIILRFRFKFGIFRKCLLAHLTIRNT